MSIRDTVVTYRAISEALHKNTEGTMREANQQAQAAAPDPAAAAAMLKGLSAALTVLEQEERHPEVLVSPNHGVASLLQSFWAAEANKPGNEARLSDLPSGLREVKFDEKDFGGWIGSFFSWWRQIKKHEWLQAPAAPEPFANKTRVAVLGDWGTGLYGAPVSANTIERDPKGYGLLIHLGDVYYAGSEGEVRERFLDIWPKINNSVSRAVNSNHEMYTGGHAYFNLTLRHPGFDQKASYFALQNDHWVLVGLDTAYDNPHRGGLTDDQVAWLRNIINNADGRKIILLSHHQGFARLESLDNGVAEALNDLLTAEAIFAWYWGHEHRCILYDRDPVWGLHGRCIGHSGYPYFRDNLQEFPVEARWSDLGCWRKVGAKNLIPGGLVLDGPNPYVSGHEQEYGAQGHLTLDFDGDHLNEIIHLPDGTTIYERRLA
jgi:hypothetical protein